MMNFLSPLGSKNLDFFFFYLNNQCLIDIDHHVEQEVPQFSRHQAQQGVRARPLGGPTTGAHLSQVFI